MLSGAPTVVVETAAHPTELDAAMVENAASCPGDPTAGLIMENAAYVSSTLQSAVNQGDEEGNVAVESLTATVMENITATAEIEAMA